jgi:hypothetical protein
MSSIGNGTDTSSQKDYALTIFVSVQLGMWCATCTCLVFYLVVRASSNMARCWLFCLRGNPRVPGDGCNPAFLVILMIVAYTLLLLYRVPWTPTIVRILQLVLLALYAVLLLGWCVVYLVKRWRSQYVLLDPPLDRV